MTKYQILSGIKINQFSPKYKPKINYLSNKTPISGCFTVFISVTINYKCIVPSVLYITVNL